MGGDWWSRERWAGKRPNKLTLTIQKSRYRLTFSFSLKFFLAFLVTNFLADREGRRRPRRHARVGVGVDIEQNFILRIDAAGPLDALSAHGVCNRRVQLTLGVYASSSDIRGCANGNLRWNHKISA